MGGAGSDRLEGEAGTATYVFSPSAGVVQHRIIGLEDVGSNADDLINVTAEGFASVAAVTASAAGDDAILDCGGGDTVRLVDYRLTTVLADIGADDFLL